MKILHLLLLISTLQLFAQNKQGNTANADVFADAPFRMKKYTQNGELTPIPVHIMIHDADGFGANVELMSIDIRLKNASDTSFSNIITFNDYGPIQFESIILHRSTQHNLTNVQNFNQSYYQTSSHHTIEFKETHNYIDGEDYVSIEEKFWFFTIMLPAEKITQFDEDIIDIHVHFNIDWAVDGDTYLRIFRSNEDVPKLNSWYRGDTHYHTIFTQNIAETGEALPATKMAGKYTGLDWQFTSDHSCDFDNYGNSITQNWENLGNQIAELNNEDSSYIFIRGLEVSLNNANGQIVHALAYPSIDNPFGNPYIGDGGGDNHGTDIYISDMLNILQDNKGFCYAAHPFAEGDKLPDLINGNVWNVADSGFITNGMPHPSNGTIICNNLSAPSDIFSDNPQKLFKDQLKGFQIWNLYNTLDIKNSRDNYYNPWNVKYEHDTDFLTPIASNDQIEMMYRFNQNLDVVKYLWKKALKMKNENPELENWKTFISAGSDAHGSFNYSNTNMYYAIYGTIENNALGKLSTLAYCPNGMGKNGKNIIKAMYNGNILLSDGPIINIGIGQSTENSIIVGQDTIFNENDLYNNYLNIDMISTNEYGNISEANLIIGTENGEFSIPLNTENNFLSFNLYDLLNSVFLNQIPDDKYFYLRAELKTLKNYGNLSHLYLKNTDEFHAFTNPIWIKKRITNKINNKQNNININIYKTNDNHFIKYNLQENSQIEISLYNIHGQKINTIAKEKQTPSTYTFNLHTSELTNGIYIVKLKTGNKIYTRKIVKL